MAHNKTLAAQLYSEFKSFFPNNAVEYFVSFYDYYQPEAYVPSSDTYIEKDSAINEHIDQMRLSATKALLERRDAIIICSVSAIYGLGDPDAYLKMLLHVSRGERIDQRAILRRLAEMQYQRNDLEFSRGTYRVRGEVIDVFPAESDDEAIRISLFDDEVEGIHYFDPLTGAPLRKAARVTIYPKTQKAAFSVEERGLSICTWFLAIIPSPNPCAAEDLSGCFFANRPPIRYGFFWQRFGAFVCPTKPDGCPSNPQ